MADLSTATSFGDPLSASVSYQIDNVSIRQRSTQREIAACLFAGGHGRIGSAGSIQVFLGGKADSTKRSLGQITHVMRVRVPDTLQRSGRTIPRTAHPAYAPTTSYKAFKISAASESTSQVSR